MEFLEFYSKHPILYTLSGLAALMIVGATLAVAVNGWGAGL